MTIRPYAPRSLPRPHHEVAAVGLDLRARYTDGSTRHVHNPRPNTCYYLRTEHARELNRDRPDARAAEAICYSINPQVHAFDNRHDRDAKFLAIATPGVFGPAYFREIAAVLGAGGPPDPAAVADVMRRHGLTPAHTDQLSRASLA